MIRVAIADDHPIIVEGIAEFLSKHPDIKVVTTAADGEEILHALKENPADVVLMDINMPKRDGIAATRVLKSKFPLIKVIIFTMYNERSYFKALIEAGADGCVLKTKGKEELIAAIHKVTANEQYFNTAGLETKASGEKKISSRELEIVRLVVQGMKAREIADRLHISELTVRTHTKNIYRKVSVNNAAELASYALNNNMLE